MSKASTFIIRLYFAVVSAVTLFTLMFGTVDLLTIGLKTYVVPQADVPNYLIRCDIMRLEFTDPPKPDWKEEYNCDGQRAQQLEDYKNEKANNIVRSLAMLIVSFPIFILHFRLVYKDWKRDIKQKTKK